MPSSLSKRGIPLLILAFAVIVALFAINRYGGSPGSVLDPGYTEGTIQGVPVRMAALQHGQSLPLPTGTRGIVTCPAGSTPEGASWQSPADIQGEGVMIYEYTEGFSPERNATIAIPERWTGKSYGFDVPDTLTAFAPGRTYHVKADSDISFSCTTGIAFSSPSSSTGSSSHTSSSSSSGNSGPVSFLCDERDFAAFGSTEVASPFACEMITHDPEDGRTVPVLELPSCEYTVRVGEELEIALPVSSLPQGGSFTALSFTMAPYSPQCDVTNDGRVDYADSATVISWLNNASAGQQMEYIEALDVNNDGFITPLDALWILNFVNRWKNNPNDGISLVNGVLRWTPLSHHIGTYHIAFSAVEKTKDEIDPYSSIVVQITVAE